MKKVGKNVKSLSHWPSQFRAIGGFASTNPAYSAHTAIKATLRGSGRKRAIAAYEEIIGPVSNFSSISGLRHR